MNESILRHKTIADMTDRVRDGRCLPIMELTDDEIAFIKAVLSGDVNYSWQLICSAINQYRPRQLYYTLNSLIPQCTRYHLTKKAIRSSGYGIIVNGDDRGWIAGNGSDCIHIENCNFENHRHSMNHSKDVVSHSIDIHSTPEERYMYKYKNHSTKTDEL